MSMQVELEIKDGLGWLWLNRAYAGNAVTPNLMQELCEGLDRLTDDAAVEAIVLSGRGDHFAAGADFGFLETLTRETSVETNQMLYQHFQGATRRLFHCRKPTVAAVAGAAITVGCELAIACDLRVAATSAFFQQSWIKMGLTSPLGGTFLLPRMIGFGRATEMMLTGRRVNAPEAACIGLVSDVVGPADLASRSAEQARLLSRMPRRAYLALKDALARGLESTIEQEWEQNLTTQTELIASSDFHAAFAEIQSKK